MLASVRDIGSEKIRGYKTRAKQIAEPERNRAKSLKNHRRARRQSSSARGRLERDGAGRRRPAMEIGGDVRCRERFGLSRVRDARGRRRRAFVALRFYVVGERMGISLAGWGYLSRDEDISQNRRREFRLNS
jgi:hypothetical protein